MRVGVTIKNMKICKVEGCNIRYKSKGYCNRHYHQLIKHGKILNRTKFDMNEIINKDIYAEIVLYDSNQEEIARTKIDIDDVEKCKKEKWRLCSGGYATTSIKRKETYLHHFVNGKIKGLVIDHINGNRLDNRKVNLRHCTTQQNSMNKKVKGCSLHKPSGYWRSRIMINGKEICIGYFKKEEEAIEARKAAEKKYFGEFAQKR